MICGGGSACGGFICIGVIYRDNGKLEITRI